MTGCPLDYSFCNQTVTLYHQEGTGYLRQIVNDALFQKRNERKADEMGQVDFTHFLLIIPGEQQTVFSGDWVVPGLGPAIEEDRPVFPGDIPGAVYVRSAENFYWENRFCHTEARGE